MARKRKKTTILEKFLVEDYASEGRSLGRWNGKVVFVERTVPGDVVDVLLFKNKKDWAEGYPLVFHELSSKRVAPFCEHFGDCGGCQWQMVGYEEQLKFKQQQVKDAVQRIAKIPLPEFSAIIGAKDDRLYRNKLEYTFGVYKYIPEKEFHKEASPSPSEGGVLDSDDSKTTSTISDSRNPPSEGREARRTAGFHAKGLFDKIVDI